MSGMVDFVRLMRTTHQRVGIATASPDAFIHQFLTKVAVDGMLLTDVFPLEAVVGSTTLRTLFKRTPVAPPFKPDPFSVHLAATHVEQEAGSRIFYVGDSLVDGFTLRNDRSTDGMLISGREKTRRDLSTEFDGNENIIFGDSLQLLVS